MARETAQGSAQLWYNVMWIYGKEDKAHTRRESSSRRTAAGGETMAATVMHSTSVEAEAEVLLVRCGVLQVMPVLWEAVTFEADQWEEMGITWSPRDLKERYLQLLGDHLRNSREDAD